MKVGVIGLGKLGLPVALALEHAGHELYGWDADPGRLNAIRTGSVPEAAHEPHLRELLASTRLTFEPHLSLARPEIVLVCVQTPHQPEFEGVTPLDRPPEDFDYRWLRHAVAALANEIFRAENWDPLVVIVSTCLPGTFDRELRALAGAPWRIRFAYHPLFIAMGSVIEDFRDPEFILVGWDHPGCVPAELAEMYRRVHGIEWNKPPWRHMSIASAELTKVAYNAFLGMKLMLANGVAMTCDAIPAANADDVMGTLKLATKRLVSPAYLTPGMGDGGGCHPRDQIALSWLARELNLPHDPYGVVVEHREAHARWLAAVWLREAHASGLPMVMLGDEYKADSSLRTGSHARLVLHYARQAGRDPGVIKYHPGDGGIPPNSCSFLGAPHTHFLKTPNSGVVVDPWGRLPDREGVRIVRPGRR